MTTRTEHVDGTSTESPLPAAERAGASEAAPIDDGVELAPPVMDRLREATQPIHDALEALPFNERLAAGEVTVDTYAAWLRALLAIHRPLEAQLRERSEPSLASVWDDQRARSSLLVDDLEQLDRPIEPPSGCEWAERVHRSARSIVEDWTALEPLDLLGMLYVTEGSTLGGMYIAERLQNAADRLESATSFYTAYGRETRPMWEAFGETMNETVREPEHIRRCLSAARATFAGMEDVLSILSQASNVDEEG